MWPSSIGLVGRLAVAQMNQSVKFGNVMMILDSAVNIGMIVNLYAGYVHSSNRKAVVWCYSVRLSVLSFFSS